MLKVTIVSFLLLGGPKPMQRPMTVGQMQQQHHTIQQQQHQSVNPLQQQTQMKGILLV